MKGLKYYLAVFGIGLLTVGCEETDYMTYDTSHNGVYFEKDSIAYSFSVTPIEVKTHTIEIPVKVMGGISKTEAREIGYEFVRYSNLTNDTVPAVEGVHFNVVSDVVEPDSVTGYIVVEVYRDELLGSYAEGYERYRLGINLVQNENYTPTLTKPQQSIVLTFDNAVEQPEWYDYKGDKVWTESKLGKWHPYKLIKMVEFFHAIEEIQPESYKKMVELYGENLEHIEYGDPYQYATMFRKYVYAPMYEFFNNPDNKEMILAEYPDFPFDFPNPYAK